MDSLAMEIHEYLLDMATDFEGYKLVLLPITEIVSKFQRNHRTVQRRISALKDEQLLVPVIKKNMVTLYHVRDQEDEV